MAKRESADMYIRLPLEMKEFIQREAERITSAKILKSSARSAADGFGAAKEGDRLDGPPSSHKKKSR